MKLKFDPDLDFQTEAVASVVDLFEGQEICQTNFSVGTNESGPQLGLQTETGIGNRLKLHPEDLLANLNKIQLRNGLKPSSVLGDLNYTVEMETGTGKTYVYLRSIFELNKRYGFTKFIIVVPSIAIKEGTSKALAITEEHFRGLYDNVRFDHFVYESQKLGQVRNFATSDCIQIMVMNIGMFNKSFTDSKKETKANIIHRAHDRMMGAKPIEFIAETNPIVIIDEPQSVDTTKKSSEAIKSLNPMCTLRYSATHRDKHHQVFRLDSVDAYERKLVKQIEVAGITVSDSHNDAYIKLVRVDNKNGISAQVEIDKNVKGKIQRKKMKVKQGDDFREKSGGRDEYDGYVIGDIVCTPGDEHISFTGSSTKVLLGQAVGEVNNDEYKRLQIRKTIDEHLKKELRLRDKGIKVLSLFFIDRVANYRGYDEDGNATAGKYARMFEEEYAKAIRDSKFADLFKGVDIDTAANGVHNGYFSIDKKSKLKDTKGNTTADGDVYQLIMRDKEKLLSFESKLKFIFSHSALREGWDNPNVFQICTLNESTSALKKRQEIGRGLRIAVNQDGERVWGFDVNTLTVMANESYEEFARKLQEEIEEDTGIRFGLIEKHLFANIAVAHDDGTVAPLGVEESETLWSHLREEGYIDTRGKVTDDLRIALKDNAVKLPENLTKESPQIVALLTKVAGSRKILNAADKTTIQLNKERFLGSEFQALWGQIKFRTTFRVDFDPGKLIDACAKEIANTVNVPKARFVYRKSLADISRGGVEMGDFVEETQQFTQEEHQPPDILTYLQNETNLTRRSLAEILRRANKFKQFKRNPNKFIEQVTTIIKHKMQLFIVDGIQYHRIGDESFYGQELFDEKELTGYLGSNMLKAKKSVYDHVVYDSDTEREFASRLDSYEDVKVYAKLPFWFKIETPLGSYNPDWAVLVERDGHERLFFVVETKGSVLTDVLRPTEVAKMKCGEAHFRALETQAKYTQASSFKDFETAIGES